MNRDPLSREIRRTARLRYVAAAVVGLIAVLYFLIGLEVLAVGRPSDGSAPDLLAFGLLVGGAHLVAAALLLVVARRSAWLGVAAFQLLVLVGYFALADIRDPRFEPWGLLVKLLQLAVLAMIGYLSVRGTAADGVARRKVAGA